MNNYHFVEKVQAMVQQFPDLTEQPCHGTPAFYVGQKMFARFWEDLQTLVLYNNERDEWIAKDADTFYITDHYLNYKNILVDVKKVSNNDLQMLIIESWKIRAPKRLWKEYEGNK